MAPPAARGSLARRGAGHVELAPFVLREGLDEIGVDAAALADGLVVVPRVSVGSVADLGDRAPAGVPPDAAARLMVEQVSSVEHAAVLGVPRRGDDGRAVIGPGLGRPLILTTLERDEAMRVLTGGATGRSRVAIACLAAGAVLVAAAAPGGSSMRSSAVASRRPSRRRRTRRSAPAATLAPGAPARLRRASRSWRSSGCLPSVPAASSRRSPRSASPAVRA